LADFISNTQLSAPQGAGSQPLAPIQQVDTFRGLASGISSIFSAVGDYAKSEEDKSKVAAQARKTAALDAYTKKEDAINQGLLAGMNPSEAAARSRANFSSFATTYSDLVPDFEKQAKALKGNTEIGQAEKALDDERVLYNQDKSAASTAGAIFFNGMDKKTEMDQIIAHKTAVTEAKALTERRAKAAEERAQGTYDQAADDRKEKDASLNGLQKIASTHLEAFQSFVIDIGNKVKTGKMSSDEGRTLITTKYNNISSGLVTISAANPTLATPFESLFKDMKALGDRMIDPKSMAEDSTNEIKSIKNKTTLMLLSDPQARAAILTNELFPNSPTAIAKAAPAAIAAFSKIASTPLDSKEFVPQVLGNPEVEGDSLKMLKEGINGMSNLSPEKQKEATIQASNSANQLLKQANTYLDGGVDPKKMVGFADFVSSEAYAKLVTSGTIDKEAAAAAMKVFQVSYTKTLINGVQQNLTGYLFNPMDRSGKPSPHARIEIKDAVDIKFTGSGIVFQAKPLSSIYPNQPRPVEIEYTKQKELVDSLNTSQKAINKLIHIGAHIEGNTDYSGYWEKHKHELLPNMFTAPAATPSATPTTTETQATPNYGMREDGTAKGSGWLGELKVPGTNNIATEYSVTVGLNGKDVLIPTLVPTLTKQEQNTLLEAIKNDKQPPKEIMNKAVDHAVKRIKEGKSPFADANESPVTKPAASSRGVSGNDILQQLESLK
jgi:hypothetical protein